MNHYQKTMGLLIGLMIMVASGLLVYRAYQLHSPKIAGESLKQPSPTNQAKIDFSLDFTRKYNGSDWQIIDQKNSVSGPSSWQKIKSGLLQDSQIHGQKFGLPLDKNDYTGSLDIFKNGQAFTNYEFNLDFTPIDPNGVGAIIRYQNPQNYYRVLVLNNNPIINKYVGPFIRIDKIQNGETHLLYSKKADYQLGQNNDLKIRCFGNKIEAYLNNNDQPVIWVIDTKNPYIAGSVGLFVFDERVIFSQIKVQSVN